MLIQTTCPPPSFSVATAAGFYTQITAVLAGFAFASLIVLLAPSQEQSPRKTKGQESGVALVLLGAMVSLLISTFNYSRIAGETGAQGRAATEELLSALPFGLAVIMLLHGLTLLMQDSNIDKAAIWMSRFTAVVVAPSFTIFYITAASIDTESTRLAKIGSCAAVDLPAVGVLLTTVAAGLLLLAIIPKGLPMRWRVWRWASRHRYVSAYGVLIVGILIGIAVGNINIQMADFLIPPGGVTAFIAAAFVVLVALGVMLAFEYRAFDERTESGAPDELDHDQLTSRSGTRDAPQVDNLRAIL